jgi:hypothetical protein
MNSLERIFALKISLIMSVRMLGLFMLFPVMSVYAAEYDNSTPLLIGMAIGSLWINSSTFTNSFWLSF